MDRHDRSKTRLVASIFSVMSRTAATKRLEHEERFISGLLSFVPPSLYLPRTDAELDMLHEQSGLNARFWKRSSSDSDVKLAMKSQSKKAKRRRYEAVSFLFLLWFALSRSQCKFVCCLCCCCAIGLVFILFYVQPLS